MLKLKYKTLCRFIRKYNYFAVKCNVIYDIIQLKMICDNRIMIVTFTDLLLRYVLEYFNHRLFVGGMHRHNNTTIIMSIAVRHNIDTKINVGSFYVKNLSNLIKYLIFILCEYRYYVFSFNYFSGCWKIKNIEKTKMQNLYLLCLSRKTINKKYFIKFFKNYFLKIDLKRKYIISNF